MRPPEILKPHTMNATARIQHKGQVTIPTAVRRQAGLQQGDLVKFTFHRGKIVITPRSSSTAPNFQRRTTTTRPLSAGASMPALPNQKQTTKLAAASAHSTPPMR